jgi:hypothetical protein
MKYLSNKQQKGGLMKKTISILMFVVAFVFATGFSSGYLPQEKQVDKPSEKAQEESEEKTPEKPAGPPEKTFEDVIKDAKKMEGLFNLYAKEDKLYLEIRPDQFDKLYLYIPTLWTSVGYGGTGSYFPMQVFYWEKLDKKVLLVWKNTRYVAEESAEYKRNLENVVPQSIAHAFKIESAPHPENNSILIDLDGFFLADSLGLGRNFSTQQNPYTVDKSRTVWDKIQTFPENIELGVRYTLSSGKPLSEPSVPDSSGITVMVRFSISELPMNNGFRPRLADDRVGYFVQQVFDYDRTGLDGTAVRYINRWHLVKKNPNASISDPVEPIVFWLENTIPPKYRKPIRDGLLEWNKAYEKAGFRNAIVVKEMPDDAEWDPADVRYNTIRWAASLSGTGGGAFGPSRVNPLTGQILDADVVMFAPINYIFSYNVFDSPLNARFFGEWDKTRFKKMSLWSMDNIFLGFERDYAIFEMLAYGEIGDVKEVPEQFMYDFYKFLACHEVGHTLGLRHNFKGSTTTKLSDLHNTKVTKKESIGNSIMEYLPRNRAPKGVKQGEYFQSTIGAWDYWVIEYGYKSIEAKTPDEELPVLEKIASRSNEPELIFGTDEDAYDFGPYSVSVDPKCLTWDLSDDPLGWSVQQVERTKDLWKQLEERSLFEGRSYVYLRQGFSSSLGQYFSALNGIVKWIGGLYHTRTHVGDPGDPLPFQVVEYEKQRLAFDIIKNNLLNPKAFSFDPVFLQKLQISRFFDFSVVAQASASGTFRMDFSLSELLKRYYQGMLRTLYDPMRLSRMQENEIRTTGKKLTLNDYMDELYMAIWSELESGEKIGPYRRILQREYLTRVTGFLLNPAAPTPDDVVAISRYQLKQLDESLGAYLGSHPDADLITRAHLDNCSDVINEALQAVYVKNSK